MRKPWMQGFVASLIGLLFLAACSMAGYTIQPESAVGGNSSNNAGDAAALQQTAQIQLVSDIHAQEAQALSATPSPISFEDKVATAVAQTKEAQNANLTFDERVQTAIAETQAAIPLDQRIQTAIAQTQVAQGLTQVAALRVSTPTPILSNALTPFADTMFTGAYVYKYGFMSGNKYLVTIQLANNVSGDYYAMVGDQQYKCSVMSGYPNRLYCIGPSVPGGAQSVSIYESTSAKLAYVSQVVLPQWTPTRATNRYYWCNGYNCNYPYNPYYSYNSYCPYGSNCYNYPNYYNCKDSDCCDGYSKYGYCNGPYYSLDGSGKCTYIDAKGACRYCKSGNVCRGYEDPLRKNNAGEYKVY